jgi:hypothetical protein
MRVIARQRRYIPSYWLPLLRPVLRYSGTRDAFVLRFIGSSIGPVLRPDRRQCSSQSFDGIDRRRAQTA